MKVKTYKGYTDYGYHLVELLQLRGANIICKVMELRQFGTPRPFIYSDYQFLPDLTIAILPDGKYLFAIRLWEEKPLRKNTSKGCATYYLEMSNDDNEKV